MVIKPTPHLGGLALVLNPELLATLRINADTELDVSVQGNHLIVTPVSSEKLDDAFLQAMDTIHTRYATAFRKLAE
jgi:antitoxin component of MazEF toxin-antitoxin module